MNQNISLQQKTNTKGINNGGNKKQTKKYQAYIENSKMEEISSSLISKYFKCKWIKISNQKTETGRMNKTKINMIQLSYVYKRLAIDPRQQIGWKWKDKKAFYAISPKEGWVTILMC